MPEELLNPIEEALGSAEIHLIYEADRFLNDPIPDESEKVQRAMIASKCLFFENKISSLNSYVEHTSNKIFYTIKSVEVMEREQLKEEKFGQAWERSDMLYRNPKYRDLISRYKSLKTIQKRLDDVSWMLRNKFRILKSNE